MEEINNFLELFADMVADRIIAKQQPTTEPSRQLKGLEGIMQVAKCGKTKAQQLKDSGVLDEAITKISARLFVIDEKKAMECLQKNKGGRIYAARHK